MSRYLHLSKMTEMATRTLYLIRHGDYQHKAVKESNHALTLEQHYKLHMRKGGLTSTGVKQAELTAQRFRSLPISAIHCSSLRRSSETAEIIAKEFHDVPIQRSRLLWECVPNIPKALVQHEDFKFISVQDVAQWKIQADRAFERYFNNARGNDKHEILVSHANLIRYLICLVLQVKPDAWVNMHINNCGISEILITPDRRTKLVSYNDVGHLPRHLRTQI